MHHCVDFTMLDLPVLTWEPVVRVHLLSLRSIYVASRIAPTGNSRRVPPSTFSSGCLFASQALSLPSCVIISCLSGSHVGCDCSYASGRYKRGSFLCTYALSLHGFAHAMTGLTRSNLFSARAYARFAHRSTASTTTRLCFTH